MEEINALENKNKKPSEKHNFSDGLCLKNLKDVTSLRSLKKLAGPTRLELATSGVTGRRSNQTELRPRKLLVGGTGLEPVTLGL